LEVASQGLRTSTYSHVNLDVGFYPDGQRSGDIIVGRRTEDLSGPNIELGAAERPSAEGKRAQTWRFLGLRKLLAQASTPLQFDGTDSERTRVRVLGTLGGYFAAAGNAGSLSMSRASCWMITLAFIFAAIFLIRSIDAKV
jgi:hypothetical protein